MKRPNNFILSVLWGMLICLALTSCENFLNEDIKDKIVEEIEIANTNPVTFYVEAEEDSGTVTPTQLRLKKKETFELRYKPASSRRFIKWEVRDRVTKDLVPGVIEFEDETALETKAKLLTPREGLEIYARAVIMPEVVSVNPPTGSTINAYIPITLTFNIPVEDQDSEGQSMFTYENISIVSNGSSVTQYFETPYFNADKTVLTIFPKPKTLSDYMQASNQQVFDITVTLSDSIVVTKDDFSIGLTQNDKTSFMIHYRPTLETVAPAKDKFFISGKPITIQNAANFPNDDKYSDQQIFDSDHFLEEDVMKNRTNGLIYIYGKYIDEDSGVKTVTVSETRIYENDGDKVTGDVTRTPVKYTADNALFIKNGSVTEFYIPHQITTDIGVVKLTVSIADLCENTDTKKYYLIKVGPESFTNFYMYNC